MSNRDEFIRHVAALALDGEDVDGEEFEWENDDAWATLHSLISGARELLDAGPVPNDVFTIDIRSHFAEGHRDQEHREAWLETIKPGALLDVVQLTYAGTTDALWAEIDDMVERAATLAGYEFGECGQFDPEDGFVCTEPSGHSGEHVARDEEGGECNRWAQ